MSSHGYPSVATGLDRLEQLSAFSMSKCIMPATLAKTRCLKIVPDTRHCRLAAVLQKEQQLQT